MLRYIVYRIVLMIPTIFIISVISFIIIQLPPGDFLTSYVTSIPAAPMRRSDTPALREVEAGRFAACHFAEELTLRGVVV